MPVLCQEDAGSKASGERTRKGMEFVLGESNGVGVWMCEGSKLIREEMEKTINTSAGRKEEQMLFQITSVHVKKSLSPPHATRRAASARSSAIGGVT